MALTKLCAQGVPVAAHTGKGDSVLGLCAAALRAHFCQGPEAILLQANTQAEIYPAFASLNPHGPARADKLYKQWVESWPQMNMQMSWLPWRLRWSFQCKSL